MAIIAKLSIAYTRFKTFAILNKESFYKKDFIHTIAIWASLNINACIYRFICFLVFCIASESTGISVLYSLLI